MSVKDLPDYTYPISIIAYEISSLPIDIVAQTVGNIAIDVAAQSIGNINVNLAASAITLDVNIAAQDVDINIKTSTGVNLVIDKLTQTAFVEDRRTLSNNGASASMFIVGTTTYRGKFFPRGCRGLINLISLYCDNTDSADHSFTIYISPQAGMGPILSATLTVPASAPADWRSVTIRRFWNYDSMFIYVIADNANYPRLGYDSGTPYDYHYSTDAVTWTPASVRIWIKVDMTAMTVGDLPVSGTINTVEIPNETTSRDSNVFTVPAGGTAYDDVQEGAGTVLMIIYYVGSLDARNYLNPLLRIDGAQVLPTEISIHGWQLYYVTTTTPGITVGVWDTTNDRYSLIVTIPYQFRRTLQVGFLNTNASTAYQGRVMYVWKKTV